ncbi:MAG: sulfide/dihydroorotate dehydrogenase-like FAD/NAD-binding protein [Candidatus Latescibacterota bacterium]|nr:MAG: sulfide/dihydroorotate dehydrogenase-like FAD/NAD-binding protein [Candidatus Latescibacterota bacterium]
MFKLIDNYMIVPNIHLLTVEAPNVAREARPGQFVIVRADNEGERIPLSLSDWDAEKGTVTMAVMNVGKTTSRLAELEAGTSMPTVVGPLGNPSEIDEFGSVLCVGGCYGIGSIYPIARALKEKNNKVFTVLEARSSYLMYWEEKLRGFSDKIIYISRDGTHGYRGHVNQLPDIIESLGVPIDRVIINGCTLLLKKASDATRPLGIKTIVSLNPIMIDGTGMCGVCRVTVGSKTRFACVDGPDFDAHEVDWDELLQRRKSYMSEEAKPLRTSGCEKRGCLTTQPVVR